MNIYERFGVTPVINAAGPATRYGGALVSETVRAAMDEAGLYSAPIEELHAAASKRIAKLTGAEAGIVTNGASAALTLAIAACIAGFDVAIMNRLPDTTGIPNEVVMPWHQVSGYDHAIWATGARLVGAGYPNDTTPPHEVQIIDRFDLASVISPMAVAVAYAPRPQSHPALEEVVEVAHARGLPVVLDASMEVPPIENLKGFIQAGADLVCVSGGKGIGGPQSSGLLYGRKDLVVSALLQMLDMSGPCFADWVPPSLIPKDKLLGKPLHGIGRGMKVSKESIIGLLVALDELSPEGFAGLQRRKHKLLSQIAASIQTLPGVATSVVTGTSDYAALLVSIDEAKARMSARRVCQRLSESSPTIYVYNEERYLLRGELLIQSQNLSEETAVIVAARLHSILAASD
jgi:L-seryl-tRNA(Ser) seleniumtransferase